MLIRDWFKGKKRHRKTDPHSGMKSSSWQQVGSKTHGTCTGTSIGHFRERLQLSPFWYDSYSKTRSSANDSRLVQMSPYQQLSNIQRWLNSFSQLSVEWTYLPSSNASRYKTKRKLVFPPLSVNNSPCEASVETRLSISSYFLVHRSFFNNTWTFITGFQVGGLYFRGISDGHTHFFSFCLVSWSRLRMWLPGRSLQSGMVWIIPNVDRQIGVQWLQLFGQELICQWVQSIWAPVQPCALQQIKPMRINSWRGADSINRLNKWIK